jgi:Domain of unknown function (DUF4282)
MAGQPQDPSFQPAGEEQEHGLTQGRPTWQPGYDPHVSVPPASTPPPGGVGGGGGAQAYAAPPPAYGGPAYSDPAYAGPGGHDQTFTAQPGQAYQSGYQSAGHEYNYGEPGQQQSAGTPPPQWNAATDSAAATPGTRTGERREKGFLGSLFDFSFSSFVTPKIIKVLFVLFTLWTALVALIITIIGFKTGGVAGGLFTLIVIVPIFVLLTLGIYRVVLEAFMVVFRIYEEMKKLRENSERASLG